MKGTRVHGYAYDVANDERALSIVFIDRASRPEESKTHALLEAVRDVYVTPAISHPVVEYICTLDIDRLCTHAIRYRAHAFVRRVRHARSSRASVPRTRRDPRELRALADGKSRKNPLRVPSRFIADSPEIRARC